MQFRVPVRPRALSGGQTTVIVTGIIIFIGILFLLGFNLGKEFPLGPDILFLKHDSSMFSQLSYPVCGSWKSQAKFSMGQTAQSLTCSNNHGETTYSVG